MAGSSLEDSEAWLQWRASVSEDDRSLVAALLVEFDTSNWNGMHKLLGALTMEVLKGNIAPIAVETVTALIDRQMAALFMEHKEANALDMFPTSAAGALVELRQASIQIQPVQPHYIDRKPDVVDMMDAEVPLLAEAKKRD